MWLGVKHLQAKWLDWSGFRAGVQISKTGFDARAGVEVVAEGVADEVETQYCQHDGERGKQYKVRGVEQVGAAVVEHGSPTGGGGRDAESEKTHGGLGEDGSGHADRGLNDDRLNDVGKNVADDDAQIAGAEGAGGFDEFAFAGGEDLSADEAGIAHPTAERKREHEIKDSGAAEGDERNRQQDSRERKKRVHQDNIDEAVDGSSVVSSDGADDESEGERGEDDATADQHGDARAVDDARENVAAQFVGAEPVGGRGRVEARGQVDRSRVLWSDPRREQGEDHEDDDQQHADGGQRIVAGGTAE